MGIKEPYLTDDQIAFIESSPLFFVATAPLSANGHVNCSPRPMDRTFFIDSPTHLGWFDLVGSGIETISHLKENGRIVIMFCSFGKVPKIMRIHGIGRVFEPGETTFDAYLNRMPESLGVRAVISIEIERISTSCGFGVPEMEFIQTRPALNDWLQRKGAKKLSDYRREYNLNSVDGLPGLDPERIT